MFRWALALVLWLIPVGALACDGPYRKQMDDGRCVWSCGKGTQPDTARNACVCKPGLTARGKDNAGRTWCAKAAKKKSSDVKKKVKRYGKRYPFNRSRSDLCARFAQFDEPGWPVTCNVGRADMQLRVLRPLEVIVRRGAAMQAEEFVPGSYRFAIRRPAEPARNSACDEAATGVRGSCRAVCERMEMLTFFDDGRLAGIKRPDHGDLGRCAAVLTTPYRIGKPTRARAWDACVREAERRSLDRWGHDARIEIPRFVAADFGFRDARTVQSSGGYRYTKKVNHQIREAIAPLPVTVHCRP